MKKIFAKIKIQGVEYKLYLSDSKTDKSLIDNDGYCDYDKKRIVIDNNVKGEAYKKHIVVHEIVHAFLHESGLRGQGNADWALNEAVVDWIAAMAEKIMVSSKIAINAYKGVNKNDTKEEHRIESDQTGL